MSWGFNEGLPAEKDLDPRHPLKSLFRLAFRQKKVFLTIFILAGISTLLTLLQPILYREAVNDVAGVFVGGSHAPHPLDGLENAILGTEEEEDVPSPRPHSQTHVARRTPHQAFKTLIRVVVLVFCIAVLAAFFNALAEIFTSQAGNSMERGVILTAFKKALRLPLSRGDSERSSYLSKQVDQVDQIGPVVNMLSLQAGPEAFRLMGIITIMLIQSPFLAALALAPLPFYAWLAWLSTKRLGLNLEAYYDKWQAITSRIFERLAGLKTVRACGAVDREVALLSRESLQAYAVAVRRDVLSEWMLFGQEIFAQLSRVAVLIVGGWKAFENQITPGDVVMLVSYIDLVYGPLDSLSGMGLMIQQHVASFRRALRVAVRKPDSDGSKLLQPGPGRISVTRLNYEYQKDRRVLHDASFEIMPRRLNALVGPSGAGKSTVVELILGLRRPPKGSILYDGQDLAELADSELRRIMAWVAADGVLFSGTLRHNLCYQMPKATDNQIYRALQEAGMKEVVHHLPDGLDTMIEDGRGPFSLGEAQRLQIARALLVVPKLLVFDEATANLDAINEARILQVLKKLRKTCTVLAISHRPGLARVADHVIVLQAGKVVASGGPRQVAQKSVYFQTLRGS
jgi:ATP-binding cassette, subfamily B, bacterial